MTMDVEVPIKDCIKEREGEMFFYRIAVIKIRGRAVCQPPFIILWVFDKAGKTLYQQAVFLA